MRPACFTSTEIKMFDREHVVWTDRLVSMLSFDLCALSLKSSLDRFTVPTCDEISPVDVCFSYDISACYRADTTHQHMFNV